jgi:excisionase family DNA binding protein
MTKLLSVKEAAELLAIKPPTIRVWLSKRRLPFVRCGRAIRIPSDAIVRFIAANTVPENMEGRR